MFRRRRTWSFDANAVAFLADDDSETGLLALAEHEDGTGRHVMVQRGFEDDEQDVELGWDRHCLVADGWCLHGAIEAWTVEERALRLALTADAAAECGASSVLVRLPDRDAARVVAESMPRLLGRDRPARRCQAASATGAHGS